MDKIFPNETYQLCFALKDAGYQSEAATDPQKWNDSLTDEQKNKGYLWTEHPTLGWYPNPGRVALQEEIEKLTGTKPPIDQHEALMRVWLQAKEAKPKDD